MTKENDQNVLALPPLKSEFRTPADTGLVQRNTTHPLKKRERQITDLAHEQRAVMEFTAQQARLGMALIGTIHEQASHTFDVTTTYIVETKNQPGRDEEHQAFIDQFSQRQAQLLAQELLGITDVSAAGVGREIHRTLYPQPEEERSVFERLFGRS